MDPNSLKTLKIPNYSPYLQTAVETNTNLHKEITKLTLHECHKRRSAYFEEKERGDHIVREKEGELIFEIKNPSQ